MKSKIKHERIEIDEVMAYTLDQLRHDLFNELPPHRHKVLGVYKKDAVFLSFLLRQALFAVADEYRRTGSIGLPFRLEIVPGESQLDQWQAECEAVNRVLAQADAMARQEGGSAHA